MKKNYFIVKQQYRSVITSAKFFFTISFFLICTYLTAQNFTHPGILHKESDFARMRQKVAEKAEPWYSAYQNLLTSSEAQVSWNPRAAATVIRGGTGDNVAVLYKDVAAAYQSALIYKISGNTSHAEKAVKILNAWSSTHTVLSGNADRYLASGLFGYQFANAAEMMRGYPGFKVEQFQKYMLNVFYKPLVERFLLSNEYGRDHNDACITNYRANWDICNMAAMLAIGIFCDDREIYNKGINYFKTGGGNGCIKRAVNHIHSATLGQWEESGRDQGHTHGGMTVMGMFLEMAYNQGDDLFSYDDYRYRKGVEYIARYNILENGNGKYNDLPYTSHSWQQGQNCSWATEPGISGAGRGNYCFAWAHLYNHYARRINQAHLVPNLKEIYALQPSTGGPAGHASTYDFPGFFDLTFLADSASQILPWVNMDFSPRNITKQAQYGSATLNEDTIRINGSGSGIQSNTDEFHYVYQRVVDNGSIITKITDIKNGGALNQAGLMIRENFELNAANVYLGFSGNQKLILTSRSTSNGNMIEAYTKNDQELSCWLKLNRSGNTFSAYVTNDTTSWNFVGSVVIDMSRDAYFGLAVSSQDKQTVCQAEFSYTALTKENARPIVRISYPEANDDRYIAPANINLKGTASDIDGSIDKVEILLNDEVVNSSKTSNINYSLGKIPVGTHKVYIKAYDNDGVFTIDSTQITVNEKTDKLPWYKCDETTGYVLADASGNNMTSRIYGTGSWVEGKVNNGIRVDGTSGYVKLPNNFINGLSDFTFACWVYPESLGSWSRILDVGTGTNTNMFLTTYNGNGRLEFKILGQSGTSEYVQATKTLPVNTWSYITVTLSDDKAVIYLNGTSIGSNNSFKLRPYDMGKTSITNYLGKSQYTTDAFFKGKFDEIRFFNYGMTAVEVATLMAESLNTSLNEIKINQNVFYPNPATDEITIVDQAESDLTIYNSLGKTVLQHRITAMDEKINIAHLSSGIYFIKISGHSSKEIKNTLIKK